MSGLPISTDFDQHIQIVSPRFKTRMHLIINKGNTLFRHIWVVSTLLPASDGICKLVLVECKQRAV